MIMFNGKVYYHGTFSRKSTIIKSRSKIQMKDKRLFNYEESDEEEGFGAAADCVSNGSEDDEDDCSISSSMVDFIDFPDDTTEITNNVEDNYVYNFEDTRRIVGIRFIPSNYKNIESFEIDADVTELAKYKTHCYL